MMYALFYCGSFSISRCFTRVWQIDFKRCTITHAKSTVSVRPILPMNIQLCEHTVLRFLRVCVIQNAQIIVGLCCVL